MGDSQNRETPRVAEVSTLSPRAGAFVAVACCLLIAVPFLVIRFVPVTDLPQHVAQVRLLLEALDGNQTYKIQWLAPGGLAYGLMLALWGLVPPLEVGRAFLLVVGAAWTCAAFGLAAGRGRSVGAAIVSLAFFFSHDLYWGFIGILVGWPVFAGWTRLSLQSGDRISRGRALVACAMSVLLHYSHPMWLIVALVWTLALRGFGLRLWARYALCLLPGIALSALWYSTSGLRGLKQTAYWPANTLERVSPEWLEDAALGGLWSDAERVILVLALAWICAGIWQHRNSIKTAVDGPLLLAALLFLLMTLTLPQFFEFSLRYAERWLPIAAMLVLIGGPSPSISPVRSVAIGFSLLAVFSLSTTGLWSTHQDLEVAGLEETIAALPANQRILGLDFIQISSPVKGRPFLHLYVFGQVAKGGSVYHSFSASGRGIVTFRSPEPKKWTPGLDWNAQLVKPPDIAAFDFVILNGNESIHKMWAKNSRQLVPVTATGKFRLYRVEREE